MVVGDGKTYEQLRKLKYEYGSELEWLIPFSGDRHTCKTFQKIPIRIYWNVGLKNIAGESIIKVKTLASLEYCGNLKKTHDFDTYRHSMLC